MRGTLVGVARKAQQGHEGQMQSSHKAQ